MNIADMRWVPNGSAAIIGTTPVGDAIHVTVRPVAGLPVAGRRALVVGIVAALNDRSLPCLTSWQDDILSALESWEESHDHGPSLTELGDLAGYSPTRVGQVLEELEGLGRVSLGALVGGVRPHRSARVRRDRS